MDMTRAEHVRWCKRRAMEYVQAGDFAQAIASMLSDLGKHPETVNLAAGPLAMMGIMSAKSRSEATQFIEGFAE